MKEVTALELRKHFGEFMDKVRYGKEPLVVKKNGRPAVVLVDAEIYRATQENAREEAFIEEYADERIREFLAEDHVGKIDRKKLLS